MSENISPGSQSVATHFHDLQTGYATPVNAKGDKSSPIVHYLMQNKVEWRRPLNQLNNRIIKVVGLVSQDLATISKRETPIPANELDLKYKEWVDYTRAKLGQGRQWSKGFIQSIIQQYLDGLKNPPTEQVEAVPIAAPEQVNTNISSTSDTTDTSVPLPL